MYSFSELESILFIDIETVSIKSTFEELSPELQAQWQKKHEHFSRFQYNNYNASESFTERAGIFAEFGKIICISCGYIKLQEQTPTVRLKTLFDEDEKNLLTQFDGLIKKSFSAHQNSSAKGGFQRFCGHNIKEFDIPYIARRMVVNNLLPLPKPLALYARKPWDNEHLDTLELWRFGDIKSFTSLELLTAILGIETPKMELNGSLVGHAYWQDKDFAKIQRYCELDVIATIQLFLRLYGLGTIPIEQIYRSTS